MGKTYSEAAAEWASDHIYTKTSVRINNLPNATKLIPENGPSRPMPELELVKDVKRFHFNIDATDPALVKEVNIQIEKLQKAFPEYRFSVKFGK